MTQKNAKKDAARARQRAHGGNYQHHLRQAGGADGETRMNDGGFIEVLVFDEKGRECLGIVTFVPPGLPNGAADPREGLIMGGIPTLTVGRYVLVEATGRARHVRAERTAGGGAFMVVFTAPDSFVALQIAYASEDRDEHGMPTTFARYKIIPHQKRPEGSVYALGILPLSDGAKVEGVRVFGWQAWTELLALLGDAHPGLNRRVAIEFDPYAAITTKEAAQTLTYHLGLKEDRLHERDCPLCGWDEESGEQRPECECLGIDMGQPLLDGDDYYDG